MPGVTYDFETTSQLHFVQEYLRCAAECAFPINGPIKKDEDMSQFTFSAIIEHSKAFRTYHWALRRVCTNLQYVVFGAWAGFSSRALLRRYWYMSRRVSYSFIYGFSYRKNVFYRDMFFVGNNIALIRKVHCV